jgi:hypothetical protein
MYDIAYTIVDELLLPPDIHVISNLAYIRCMEKEPNRGSTTSIRRRSLKNGFRK